MSKIKVELLEWLKLKKNVETLMADRQAERTAMAQGEWSGELKPSTLPKPEGFSLGFPAFVPTQGVRVAFTDPLVLFRDQVETGKPHSPTTYEVVRRNNYTRSNYVVMRDLESQSFAKELCAILHQEHTVFDYGAPNYMKERYFVRETKNV